jgi:NADPH2:quinone reductase
MNDYIATREDLLMRADELFALAKSGELSVRIHEEFPLARAGDAHRALESRATTGKVLLVP